MESNNLVRKIHIGSIIKEVAKKQEIDISKILQRLKCSNEILNSYFESASLDTDLLLNFSKILRFDFFRLYSSHLMMHHGISNTLSKKNGNNNIEGVSIRKNVYTKEIIDYVLKKIRNNEMTKKDVMSRYGIPKTTLYKWLLKYPDEKKKQDSLSNFDK